MASKPVNEDGLTRDAFLGGRLHLWQPRRGYRAGVDPVLLAASVEAQAGEVVLDLGCGVGAAALALGARVPGLRLIGVEREPSYADLARRNGVGAGFEVWQADLRDLPGDLRQLQVDHVLMNPPYYNRAHGSQAPDRLREAALGEDAALADWLRAGAARLRPRGWLWLVQKADRLGDVLAGLPATLGSVEIRPLAPRAGRPAELILLRARKDGRAPLRLLAPLVLHAGARHMRDGEDYSPAVRDALRDGAALPAFAAG